MLNTIRIFGLNIITSTIGDLFSEVIAHALQKKKIIINYANAHTINLSYENKNYFNILKKSDIIYPDGIAVVLSSRLKKSPIPQRVTLTSDLFQFCDMAKKNKLKIFFIGAEEKIIKKAVDSIQGRCGKEIIAGYHNGYFSDDKVIIELINKSCADIVLVGMGSPSQESWIINNHLKVSASVFWAVGGLFDFYGGKATIAPHIIQYLNIEWLWRLIQEPKRLWKRYIIGNPLYIFRTFSDVIKPRE